MHSKGRIPYPFCFRKKTLQTVDPDSFLPTSASTPCILQKKGGGRARKDKKQWLLEYEMVFEARRRGYRSKSHARSSDGFHRSDHADRQRSDRQRSELRLRALIELHQDLPPLWVHESVRRCRTLLSHFAHLRAGNRYEVILSLRIEEGHFAD